eukprot:scaffold764_cov363-Pavlova_lutheri.AAC.9
MSLNPVTRLVLDGAVRKGTTPVATKLCMREATAKLTLDHGHCPVAHVNDPARPGRSSSLHGPCGWFVLGSRKDKCCAVVETMKHLRSIILYVQHPGCTSRMSAVLQKTSVMGKTMW